MTRAAILMLLAIAATAHAQDRPLTSPNRDVDVTYRVLTPGKDMQQRSRFDTGGRRVRIDTPSPGLYLLVDRGARTMDFVSEGDRSVLEMPFDPTRTVAGLPQSASYTRLGDDTVAGVGCTEWQTSDPTGRPIVSCLTADGVLLRVRSGGNVLIQAVRVAYGTIPASVFAIPPGFQRREAPTR